MWGGETSVIYTNPEGNLYIDGDHVTEGSHRFSIDIDTGFIIAQVYLSEIWQPASLITGAASLWLGSNVAVAGVGHHLVTETSEGKFYFHPYSQFDEQLTTSDLKVVNVYNYETRRVLQPDNIGEFIGTNLEFSFPSFAHVLANNIHYKVGSLSATKPIRIQIWKGLDDTGSKVFDHTYSHTLFIADTEVEAAKGNYVEYENDTTYFLRYSSDANFSLKTDVTLSYPWFAADVWDVREDNILQTSSWVTGSTWNTGDYFIKNRKIYVCKVTGAQTGTFESNADKWETIGESHVTYNEVADFASLPDPVQNASTIYIVLASTGFDWNRRKGLYHSDGATWTRLSNVNYDILDAEAFFRDDIDSSKIGKFELSEISPATTRTFTFPDVSGRLLVDGMSDDASLGGDLMLTAGVIEARGLSGDITNFVGGSGSGVALTIGTKNVFIGYESGDVIGTETESTFVGYKAGKGSATSGSTGIGANALQSATGSGNIGIGYQAGKNSTGENGVFIGYNAGNGETENYKLHIKSTIYELIEGDFKNGWLKIHGTLEATTGDITATAGNIIAKGLGTGSMNFVAGEDTGNVLTNGINNVLIGEPAGLALTEGSYNILVGRNSGNFLTTESYNTLIGLNSGFNATGLVTSVGLGYDALRTAIGAVRTTAIGAYAGNGATATDGVYLGTYAGNGNTTNNKLFISNQTGNLIEGDFANKWLKVNGDLTVSGILRAHGPGSSTTNFVGGGLAGQLLTTGYANTLVGYEAGNALTIEHINTFIGFTAGWGATDLTHSVGIGQDSLKNSVGANRTYAFGRYAGENSTGSDCLYLGYEAGKDNVENDKLFIGNGLTPLIEGDFVNDFVRIHGSLKADTQLLVGDSLSTYSAALHVRESTGNTGVSSGIVIEQDGSLGDATLSFVLTANRVFTVGIDNSDDDKFKIAKNGGFGNGDDYFTMAGTTLGNVTQGNIGINNTDPEAKLDVIGDVKVTGDTDFTGETRITGDLYGDGRELWEVDNHNTSTDALDVSDKRTVIMDTSSLSITLGGLSGGFNGQLITIVKPDGANTLTIEHNESTGTQKIFTPDGTDIVIGVGQHGGVDMLFYGGEWIVVATP